MLVGQRAAGTAVFRVRSYRPKISKHLNKRQTLVCFIARPRILPTQREGILNKVFRMQDYSGGKRLHLVGLTIVGMQSASDQMCLSQAFIEKHDLNEYREILTHVCNSVSVQTPPVPVYPKPSP